QGLIALEQTTRWTGGHDFVLRIMDGQRPDLSRSSRNDRHKDYRDKLKGRACRVKCFRMESFLIKTPSNRFKIKHKRIEKL
ncbi:hypothetical protein, partial [Blautia obeum]|uniref:hypothetical protein n=1 Tax=Blautia obeum TaxID=40520 RepID=UPI001A9B7888